MELNRVRRQITVIVLCPAGCFHVRPTEVEAFVLQPDSRDAQLLIPFTPTTRPCPN